MEGTRKRRNKSPTKKSPTKKLKRLVTTKTDKTPSPIKLTKGKCENMTNFWNEPNLSKIVEHLKAYGFHGEYDVLKDMFPATSISIIGLQKIFQQFSRWSEPIKEDPKDKDGQKRSEVTPSPVEEWILAIRDAIEVQRFALAPSLILEWIAMFEEHPDPSTPSCCEVDYKKIYLYLSSLCEGSIPPQLNQQSATKLLQIFDQLVRVIRITAGENKPKVRDTARLAVIAQPIQRLEKNQLLRERRRTEWSEAENKLKKLTQSPDLEEVKKVYCDKPGLNPFSFPPTMVASARNMFTISSLCLFNSEIQCRHISLKLMAQFVPTTFIQEL